MAHSKGSTSTAETLPDRKSVRLIGYDYSGPGAYFITICTHGRKYLFGEIHDQEMVLSQAGRIVEPCWDEIPQHFPNVKTDVISIMPNHIHGVLFIQSRESSLDESPNANPASVILPGNVGAKNFSPGSSIQGRKNESLAHFNPRGTSRTIGSVVRGFKIGVTKWIRQNTRVRDVWQRGFYEHVIRNDESLRKIREYIVSNPRNWNSDPENPEGRVENKLTEPWEV